MRRIAAILAIMGGWFFCLSWPVAVADELAEADRLFAQGGGWRTCRWKLFSTLKRPSAAIAFFGDVFRRHNLSEFFPAKMISALFWDAL
jgi:hypothetical protein